MPIPSSQHPHASPKRKKIFFPYGFQLRYTTLVTGSLLVLLAFAGLHAVFVAKSNLPIGVYESFRPELEASTWRLFLVGVVYVGVITFAAMFMSHRMVGPTHRLESEIKKMTSSTEPVTKLHVRDGDELESFVTAINHLLEKVKKEKHE